MNDPALSNIVSSQIGNDYYTFKVFLQSADGRARQIKPAAVKELVIEDSFEIFYHQGYIILDNTFDYLERNDPQAANDLANSSNRGFLFRGDSRDFLIVEIKPKIEINSTSDSESVIIDSIFKMNFIFAIYNNEEVNDNSPGRKHKILYFWDNYYEILKEKNVDFSTSLLLQGDTTQLSDIQRQLYTGDAIRALLEKTFDSTEGPGITISEEWDQGATGIFFSAPAQYKAIDSLNYLLSRHVSTAGNNFDQCFLEIERHNRSFKLASLKSFFDRAYNGNGDTGDQYYLETYIIGEYNDSTNTIPVQEIRFTPKIGAYFNLWNNLTHYTTDFMPGLYSQDALVARLVHSYNTGDKAFNIDIERNSIETSMDIYNKNYVSTLRGSRSPSNNYLPGILKQKNKNIKNVYSVNSTDSDQRLSAGRNKFLRAGVFLNQMLTFTTAGSTHRQAGRFIGLDRQGAIQVNDFDSKVLGIYFIVNVRHIFKDGDYSNEIKCVKTYASSNLFLNNNAL
jgi:hypothetical protein